MTPQKAGKRHFRFVQLLAGMLLLILATSMASIAIVSSYFARQSIKELSDVIVQQTLRRVNLRIESLLDQAQNVNEQTKLLIDCNQLKMDDFVSLGYYFAHSLPVLNNLSNLGLGVEKNGDFLFAENMPDGTLRVEDYISDETGKRIIRRWRMNKTNRDLVSEMPSDGYDPRMRPWYKNAAAGRSGWTETYRFWKRDERGAIPGITYSTPILDSRDKLQAVLMADINLTDLCRFLAVVRDTMIVGTPFVMEKRQDNTLRLIAHPDPATLPDYDHPGAAPIKDPAVAACIESELSTQEKITAFATGEAVSFTHNGATYYGSALEFKRLGGPKWVVAVVMPERQLMSGVMENDRRAFWIGIASLALTALLSVRLARRVGKPLRQLTAEADDIRRLNLTGGTDLTSRISEVVNLAHSMNEMKTSLKSFQKFVPVEVVRGIVTGGGEARLGGRSAPLTVFFSDITNFTTEAEAMAPDDLVEHIGEYLGAMSVAIQDNGGTVDKFIGDGIMAFWGAPQPDELHAAHACRAALEHQRVLAALRESWRKKGRPQLRARIGLHSGTAIVGNIGSEQRLNYTAIGDTVNVASRVEGLNKIYGTNILVSEACAQAAGDAIVTRPVDNVNVKGRVGKIVVFELLGMTGETAPEALHLARLSTEAFAAYVTGDMRLAAAGYLAVLKIAPADTVAEFMLQKACEILGKSGMQGH